MRLASSSKAARGGIAEYQRLSHGGDVCNLPMPSDANSRSDVWSFWALLKHLSFFFLNILYMFSRLIRQILAAYSDYRATVDKMLVCWLR